MPDQSTGLWLCRNCGLLPIAAFHPSSITHYGHLCRDCRATARKARYEAHRDAELARNRAWARNHPEAMRSAGRAYYHRHAVERLARAQAWAKTHPEAIREYARSAKLARKAWKRNLPYERIDVRVVAERDKDLCHICGKKVAKKDRSLDHVIPLSQGGPTLYWNIKLAHRRCNSARGAGRTPGQPFLPLTESA